MIKDKTDQREKPRDVPERPAVSLPEEVQQNALAEMYLAVRRALQTIREREDDLRSPPFFKTLAIDNGQFARIVLDENMESEVIFPAVFITTLTSAIWFSSSASARGVRPCAYASSSIR